MQSSFAVSEIIHADKDRRYVVPSAPGKRGSKDTKVTDMLYDCYSAAGDAEALTKKIAAIQARYQEIIDGLGLGALFGGTVQRDPGAVRAARGQ